MKKSIILLSLFLLVLVTGTVFANSCSLGIPSPTALLTITRANSGSNTVYWTVPNVVPPTAKVSLWVQVRWTVSGSGYSGLHVILSNASGRSAEVQNGIQSTAFNGQIANQKWTAYAYVQSLRAPIYVSLKDLTIQWQ